MLTFEQPLLLLLLLPASALVYLSWQRMALPFSPRQRNLIVASRLALLTLIIAALAGASWSQPITQQTTVFVGDISASTAPQRAFMENWINAAIQHKQLADQVGIVAVGRNALVEQSVTSLIDFSHFESTPDTDYTDLAAGLRLASAIMPANSQRHIILLTDGQQNVENALQQARLLQQEGIRLDIVALPNTTSAEARIDGIDAPTTLHRNESFVLHLKLYSNVTQSATLHLYLDQKLISQQSIQLVGGQQELSFHLLAPPPGSHTYHTTISAPLDTIYQNNEASSYVKVQGPPHVLVIEGKAGNGHNIIAALQATQMLVNSGTPNEVPTTLDGLARYDSVILVDVPALALGNTRMLTLQAFVRDLGRGLVVTGGQNSYGVGGYANTPLEQTLPVSMDIPQRKDTPGIAVVLIIEDLETKASVNISKEAAKGVINLLTPRDQVGISSAYGKLTIPMQYVTNKEAIIKAIDAMNPSDPPSYNPDLSNAEQVLLQTNAKIKHVILLGDGDAFDNYQPQTQKMAGEGITISTVATNAGSVQELDTMVNIASWGKGRFYRADDPTALPQILLEETQQAARRAIINEPFVPAIIGTHPILSGLKALPNLEGYVATTPKPHAQMVLVSHHDDPVLAAWQYGLGRVVAWTSDAEGVWTKDWLSWQDAPRWWANLVTWTLPSPDSALNVSGKVVNGEAQLAVDLPSGTPINSQDQQQVQAHIVAPDQAQQTINLQPTAPQHWEGHFPALQTGAYFVQVIWHNQQQTKQLTATTGLIVPYSPEYITAGTDLRFLALLAQAGGGILLNPSDSTTAFTQSLPPVSATLPISFLLLTLAALLLPIDVAVRRLSGLESLSAGYHWLLSRFSTQRLRAAPQQQVSVTTAHSPLSTMRNYRTTRRVQTRQPRPSAKDAATPNPTTARTTSTTDKAEQTVLSTTEKLLAAKRKRAQENEENRET